MLQAYSKRLGVITPRQFQAALARFDLGTFVNATPIPFGLFGQNVFVSSAAGEWVLRGSPHYDWQFPTEQFFANLIYERTTVPVPHSYLVPGQPGHLEVLPADRRRMAEKQNPVARGLGVALYRILARVRDLGA